MSKDEKDMKQDGEGIEEDVDISPITGKPIQKKFAPKKRKKSSNWLSPENYLQNLKPGDNTTLIGINIKLIGLPDIDMNNPTEVADRLSEYFRLYAEADVKPTVAGMAIALNGMSTNQLRCIVHNRASGGDGYKPAITREVALVVKKAYSTLENLWESYMNSGKINPVSGIFLGKNNYGYQDKTEHVVTANTTNESDFSVDDIKARYLDAEERKRLASSDT
jgi:hypothetical protein|nr:MAG TPA: Terminase small subunit [Caudoviricetes sp.]